MFNLCLRIIKSILGHHLSSRVRVERGAQLGRCVSLSGDCYIGAQVVIENNVVLRNTRITGSCLIKANTILEGCVVLGDKNIIGPSAYCRNVVVHGDDNIIGFCAELTRSEIGCGVRISHHSFVGDAKVDDFVIIGAGAVTANYKKGQRFRTHLKTKTLVACNVTIIAPYESEEGAVLPAGSVIKQNGNQQF